MEFKPVKLQGGGVLILGPNMLLTPSDRAGRVEVYGIPVSSGTLSVPGTVDEILYKAGAFYVQGLERKNTELENLVYALMDELTPDQAAPFRKRLDDIQAGRLS